MRQVPHSVLRLIFPFFTVIILDAMSTGMMAPVLAPLVNAPHGILAVYSLAERHFIYGIILGLWPLCFMFGAPIFGYVSDIMGRKKVLIVCLLGTMLSFIFYILSFHYLSLSILLLGRVIGGITSGSQGVAQAAIADISSGREKAANIGVIAVAMTIGLVLGPLLGGIFSDKSLVSWFSNAMPFYLATLLSLANLVLLWFYLQETHLAKTQAKINFKHFFSQLSCLFRSKSLRILLFTFFLFELAWSLYFQSLALLLVVKFHFSNHMIGIFSAYVGLILSLGLIFLLRFLIKFFSLSKLIFYSVIIGTAAIFAAFILPDSVAQWLFAIPIALIVAVAYSSLIAKASNAVDAELQGLLMGSTDALLALAFAITGFLSGVVAGLSVSLPQLLAVIFMALAIWMFRKYFRLAGEVDEAMS